MLRRDARVRADKRLGGLGGLLQRSPAEVGDLLRMADRPGGVGEAGRALVAVIGHRDGVTLGRTLAEALGRDAAGEAAVAELQVAPVPRRALGDPDLDADGGVGAGPGDDVDLACAERPSRRERGAHDRRMRQLELDHLVARRGRIGAGGERDERKGDRGGPDLECPSHPALPA